MSNRHTAVRLSIGALLAIIGLSVSMMTFAQSADSSSASSDSSISSASSSAIASSASSIDPSGIGTITINSQNSSPRQVFGTWTLLTPGDGKITGSGANISIPNTPAGSYTLFVTAPNGFSTSIRTYKGSTQLDFVDRSQITFKLENGEAIQVMVNYALTKTGIISVQSDPSGLSFTLKGPNNLTESGTTPMSYPDSPEGQFSVRFTTLGGCNPPPLQNQKLVAGGRVSFTVTLSCKSADKLRERQQTDSVSFITVTVNGTSMPLRDVPQSAWFATYVSEAATKGILTGYNDEHGNPTGTFGPGNNVTVAELAKIAHKMAGISESSFIGKNPENPKAVSQWFSPFIASAENRGWTIYKDANIDPLRSATRSEVLETFLQVMNVPLQWQKGDLFTDVTVRTRFAGAVETAAHDGVVNGLTDAQGNALNTFDPEGSVNRAELAKIVNKALEIYGNNRSSSSRSSR